MDPHLLSFTAQLSNDELLARVKHLATREREVTTALIVHLAELDARRLYLAEGCSSLFVYCTQVLHLSEHAAYGRIAAARAARKFPVILERLSEGSVNLTTVVLLAAHLSPQNHRNLLDAARDKTRRQVEELVARLRPQPDVPASVRRLPNASHAYSSVAQDAAADSTCEPDHRSGPDCAARGRGQEEAGRREPPARQSRDRAGIAAHPGRGEARRLAPGRRPVRLCRQKWPPLHGAGLPGVPSRGTPCGGRRADGR